MNRLHSVLCFVLLSSTFACGIGSETTGEDESSLQTQRMEDKAEGIPQTALPSLVTHGAHSVPGASTHPTQETAEVVIVANKDDSDVTGAESSLDDMTRVARVTEKESSGVSPAMVQKVVGY